MDDFESCIDDRCPTIWGGPPPRSDGVLHEAHPHRRDDALHHHTRVFPASRPNSEVLPEEPRVNPIDGALLRKLFKATVDEKRKAAERERAAQQCIAQEFVEATEPKHQRTSSNGFYVPGSGSRVEKVKSKEGEAKDPEPVKHAGKENKKKQKASPKQQAKHEQTREARLPSPVPFDVDLGAPSVAKASKAQDATAKPEAKPKEQAKSGDEKVQQKQPKLSKKQKKQQKKAEDEQAKAAAEAAEALMSGGLVAEEEQPPQDAGEQWPEADFIQETAPRSASKSVHADLQPTVESVASSRSRGSAKQSPKPVPPQYPPFEAAPGFADFEKAPSFVSWEEVGQGVVGEEVVKVASRIASHKSGSKKSSHRDFQQLSPVWDEPLAEQAESERHPPAEGWKTSSKTSSKRRELETQHVHSRQSRSRHSARSRLSRQSADDFGAANDAWLQEEQAEVRSRASRSRTKTPSAEHYGGNLDAWGKEDVGYVGSKHSSQRRASRHASQLTFEEVGAGQVFAMAEPVKSRASTRKSNHSDPFPHQGDWAASPRPASRLKFEEVAEGQIHPFAEPVKSRASSRKSGNSRPLWNQGDRTEGSKWSAPASRKTEASRSSRKAPAAHEWGQDEQAWEVPNPAPVMSRLSMRSKKSEQQSANYSTHDDEIVGQALDYPASDRYHEPERRSGHSLTPSFEEVGRGWQGPDADERSGRSRITSARSKIESIQEREVSVFDDRPPGSWQSQGWGEVEEQQSAVLTAQTSNRSYQSSDSGTPLENVRPTVFAGRGWISPHPLSRSPTEFASPPQSKIVLPSEAYPHGATISYEEWKEMQEEGMRRNFSATESHLTVGAKRVERRHRFAGWGEQSSDGHRFEDEGRADTSVSGPTSYRPPSNDSERSSEGVLSDERPPTGYTHRSYEASHQGYAEAAWEEQPKAESSERSGRHSRVQTLSEWSHDHSGSKQAHDGSSLEGSQGSHDSGHASSRHDTGPNRHQSSRNISHHTSHKSSSRHSWHPSDQASDKQPVSVRSQEHSAEWQPSRHGSVESHQRYHRSGRHSDHTSHHDSDARSASTRDQEYAAEWEQSRVSKESHHSRHQSSRHSNRSGTHHHDKQSGTSGRSQGLLAGWGRFSLGTAVSRQSSRKSSRQSSRHHSSRQSSHRSSHHNKRQSSLAQSNGNYADWHQSPQSSEDIHHGSHRSSRHIEERSASAQSQAESGGWGQQSKKSAISRHTKEHSASAQSQAQSGGWAERSNNSARSRHTEERSTSVQSQAQSGGWGQPSNNSVSSSERVMEVMEEGRNVWSDIPQYDGTVSDRDRIQGYIERSEVSQTPTSRLYLNRYGVGEQESVSTWQ